MESAEESRTEQRMLDVSLILLVAYNAIYLADTFLASAWPNNLAEQAMAFIDERRGWVTLFEAVAAISLFLDLVVRFDQYESKRRNARIFCVAIASAGLVFKAFTFYLSSSYLE